MTRTESWARDGLESELAMLVAGTPRPFLPVCPLASLNSNSKSSAVKLRIGLLSADTIASARSHLAFCNSRILSSTVSRQMVR